MTDSTPEDDQQLDWDRDRFGPMADYADDPEHELTPEDNDDEKGL